MTDEFLTEETEIDNDNEVQPQDHRGRGLKRAFYVVFWIAMFITAIFLDSIFFPHFSFMVLFQ